MDNEVPPRRGEPSPPNPPRPVAKTRSYREYDTVYDAAMDEAERSGEWLSKIIHETLVNYGKGLRATWGPR